MFGGKRGDANYIKILEFKLERERIRAQKAEKEVSELKDELESA